jgi:hypothetical protein
VLLAWVLAAVLIGRAVLLPDGHVHEVVADCLHVMGLFAAGAQGPILQVMVFVLASLSILAVGVLVTRLGLAWGRARMRTQRHCETAWLIADPLPGPGGSIVLDTAERVVYCVAGRPPVGHSRRSGRTR